MSFPSFENAPERPAASCSKGPPTARPKEFPQVPAALKIVPPVYLKVRCGNDSQEIWPHAPNLLNPLTACANMFLWKPGSDDGLEVYSTARVQNSRSGCRTLITSLPRFNRPAIRCITRHCKHLVQ